MQIIIFSIIVYKMGVMLYKIWGFIFDPDKKDIDKNNIIEKLANILKLEKKKSEHEYYEYPPLERKINLSELPEEIRNPISKIPKINKKYICKKCGEAFLIDIYQKPFSSNFLYIKCHNEYINLNDICNPHLEEIDNYYELIDIKEDLNKNNELILPFNSIYKLADFFLFAQLYNNIKSSIKEYNLGETKNNSAFTFFENLLSIVLYNKDEKENNINFDNLLIFDKMTYNFFAAYNKIQVLSNGKKFYFKKRKEIPIVVEMVRLYNFEEKFGLYELYNNIYCFFLYYYIMIIKGNLEEINFKENSENIIYIYKYDGILCKNIKIKHSCINSLFEMLKERKIAYIGDDLLLGVNNDYQGYNLYLFDLKNMSFELCKLDLNDEILLIIYLEKNSIKYPKNKDSVQLLLIGCQYIFLLEYIKDQKRYEKIKDYKYTNNKKNSFDKVNYLTNKNKLIFSINNMMYCFNINTFQLISVNTFEDNCMLANLNKHQIICTIKRKKKESYALLMNLNNNKAEDIETLADLIIDKRYLFYSFYIYDLKNKSVQTFHENIPPEINEYNSYWKKLFINKNQFIIYYVYLSKDDNVKSFIDFYTII